MSKTSPLPLATPPAGGADGLQTCPLTFFYTSLFLSIVFIHQSVFSCPSFRDKLNILGFFVRLSLLLWKFIFFDNYINSLCVCLSFLCFVRLYVKPVSPFFLYSYSSLSVSVLFYFRLSQQFVCLSISSV